MRKTILSFAILALFAFVSISSVNVKADIAIGATLENFKLSDTNGKTVAFSDLKGKNGAVVVFLSSECPVVRGYNDRINQIAADYQAKGISFIGINSNSTEFLGDVKKHAEEHYKFPVLIDTGNVIADKFGANVTPEMFYFNEKNVLVYHGAIDNDRSGGNVTSNYLRDALDAGLAGKPVAKTMVNAFGCGIKRAEKN
ncbi:MAG: thioredoxin family protein [Pyrinomonadaceae bacterium]